MTACSKSNSVVRNHEKENLSLEKRKEIDSIPPGNTLSSLGKSTSSEADIINFEKSILDPDELLDPKTANAVETREKIARLNKAILELHNGNRDFLTKNKTIEKYEALYSTLVAMICALVILSTS